MNELITPLEQFKARAIADAKNAYLHFQNEDGWQQLTWEEVDQQARSLAAFLLSLGCQRGDKVAIFSKNSPEWVISDIAIMMAGLVSVPIYASAGEDMINHILSHSESRLVLIGTLDDYSAAAISTKNHISIGWHQTDQITCTHHWQQALSHAPLSDYATADADDIFTITYTSGSTGPAKGVVLTHANIGWQAINFRKELQSKGKFKHRALSYLPLAHITERSTLEIASWYNDFELYFNNSLETFLDDVKYAKPTLFVSVPRLWVKFQAGILAKIDDSTLQKRLKWPVIGKLMGYLIRRKLGLHHVIYAGCGSAPVSPDTLKWYLRLGLNVCEGWGMTETCGVACMNLPFNEPSLGTIGKPLNGFELKLSDTDEIYIRGKAVFNRYYKNDKATEEAFDGEWFKTGDKGWQSPEGDWRITGRANETFKTAKGKFVNPVPIERKFAINTDIEQCCVIGQGRANPMIFVVLNESIKMFNKAVSDHLEATVQQVNASLEPHEQVNCLFVCSEPWTINDGLLTPTLKLKRNNIKEKYLTFFEQEFDTTVVWETHQKFQKS